MESEAQKACPLMRRNITFSDMRYKYPDAMGAHHVEVMCWDISDDNVWGYVVYPTAGEPS